MKPMDTKQLDALLAFQNEDVLSRFMDQYKLELAECLDIFQETKKFLYISQIKGVFIPDDLLILDEMWHNFILFTPVYHSFCQHVFGRYFHHLPATKEEKERKKELNIHEPEKAKEEFLTAYERLLEITYDHLGESTVAKWFQIYPTTYSKENLKALRR